MYYTYMLRCRDNSIYTGITVDIERRMNEHFNKDKKCAKYTLNHTAERLECIWESNDRVLASKLEYHIKKLPKNLKEELIQKNNLEELLITKIDPTEYRRIK